MPQPTAIATMHTSLGDIRLRVAIATLPPEACLDGSGDVVLPWVHALADWANRKEARRLSEAAVLRRFVDTCKGVAHMHAQRPASSWSESAVCPA